MTDDDNLDPGEDLVLPSNRSTAISAPASTPLDNGSTTTLGADTQARLDRALDSAHAVSAKMETYAKRLAGGAAVVVFLSVILLMVAGGRLSGQVDALQAATLSITKRVVNMNSALDRMVVLEQRLALLDEGHAQMVEAVGQLDARGMSLAEQVESSMSAVQSTVLDTSDVTRSGVESTRAMIAQLDRQAQQLGTLTQRIAELELGLTDVAALKRDVATLVEIERDNLTELFEAQLALEQAQIGEQREQSSGSTPSAPEKSYSEDAIVFPEPASRQ